MASLIVFLCEITYLTNSVWADENTGQNVIFREIEKKPLFWGYFAIYKSSQVAL